MGVWSDQVVRAILKATAYASRGAEMKRMTQPRENLLGAEYYVNCLWVGCLILIILKSLPKIMRG